MYRSDQWLHCPLTLTYQGTGHAHRKVEGQYSPPGERGREREKEGERGRKREKEGERGRERERETVSCHHDVAADVAQYTST